MLDFININYKYFYNKKYFIKMYLKSRYYDKNL